MYTFLSTKLKDVYSIFSPGGNVRSNYMGLFVIVPKSYEVLRADMGRLVNKKATKWESLSWFWRKLGYGNSGYHKAKTSWNWYIILEILHDNRKFVVANYHMPC